MAIVHFVRKCRDSPACASVAGVELRGLDATRGHDLVSRLAEAVITGPGPAPTPAGLVAELTGRPGRAVEAWLAIDAEAAPEAPLGIAMLVAGTGERGVRHSISWLIVHPQVRRRGVGRWLANEACRRAHALGATEVSVECHSAWHHAVAFWRSVGFEESPRRPTPTRLGEQSPG